VERPAARPGEEGQGARAAREKLEQEIQRLKQSLANRSLEVDFFKDALQTIRLDASEIPRLPRGIYDEIRGVMHWQGKLSVRADVPVSRGQPSRILPVFGGNRTRRGRDAVA